MILLTGASGFIGKHLLSALLDKFGRENVLALTSEPIDRCAYIIHNNYQFDESIFESNGYADIITTIIHAGAFAPKNMSEANDVKKCNQNIFSTNRLLSSVLPNVKQIIYLSTLDVYGESDLISENSLINPISLYGHSKLYSEKMISAWADSKKILCHVLRIGHVYGPGEEAYKKLIPVTMEKILQGRSVEIWGDGTELRSFIYIDDVVKAILNCLSLEKEIGPVNIVSGRSVTVKQIVQLIINVSTINAEIVMLPKIGPSRNLTFDNDKMIKYLLVRESSLKNGLKAEWNFMSNRKL